MNYSFVFFLNNALLGVGLAMDAFSVSLANGLHEPKMRMKKMCGIAGTFGAFSGHHANDRMVMCPHHCRILQDI